MKRTVITLIVTILFTRCSIGESKNTAKTAEESICNCYGNNSNIEHKLTFDDCLDKYISENLNEILVETGFKDSSEIESKVKIWAAETMLNLVENCNKFLNDLEQIKIESFTSKNTELTNINIDSLSMKVTQSEDVYLYLELGRLYLELKNYDDAIVYLEKANNLNKNEWKVFSYLGWSYEQQKNYSKAQELYGRGLDLDTNNFYLKIAESMVKGKLKTSNNNR